MPRIVIVGGGFAGTTLARRLTGRLSDGSRLKSATVVATIGTAPNPLVERLGLPMIGSRIDVAHSFEVPSADGIWALGDCAHAINAETGKPSPPTAQLAVRQAHHLAGSLLDAIAGQTLSPFRYRPRGSMAVTGHLSGVAELRGVQLSDLPAWLLWRAYYLSQLPTIQRKIRLYVEWTWGMFFQPDITLIRFARSGDDAGPQSLGAASGRGAAMSHGLAVPPAKASLIARIATDRRPDAGPGASL